MLKPERTVMDVPSESEVGDVRLTFRLTALEQHALRLLAAERNSGSVSAYLRWVLHDSTPIDEKIRQILAKDGPDKDCNTPAQD